MLVVWVELIENPLCRRSSSFGIRRKDEKRSSTRGDIAEIRACASCKRSQLALSAFNSVGSRQQAKLIYAEPAKGAIR
jgi:hypothetical protein